MNYREYHREVEKLNRWGKFWWRIARVTRFSIHGFVLSRLNKLNERGAYLQRVGKQVYKEAKRCAAIERTQQRKMK